MDVWSVCAFLFAETILVSAPKATTATIEKTARDTIISTRVKARVDDFPKRNNM
jgi:hypothetical protein